MVETAVAAPAPEVVQSKPVALAAKKKLRVQFNKGSEWWLNKIGIGLLLLGLTFLFKYSIDQGWLTPAIRVLFGFGLGAVLIGIGYMVRSNRERFAMVMFGGGIASWYITIFAAFDFYSLIGYSPAVSLMVLVTAIGFGLAAKFNHQVLAVIALLGGMATPIVLESGSSDPGRLAIYTLLVAIVPLVLYALKGWRVLLVLTVLGNIVLTILMVGFLEYASEWQPVQVVVQVCLTMMWVMTVDAIIGRSFLQKRKGEDTTDRGVACANSVEWAIYYRSYLCGLASPVRSGYI